MQRPDDATAVALVSGGVDSTTMAYWLADEGIRFVPVFIDYGQHTADRELASIRQNLTADMLATLEVLDLRSVYAHSDSCMICPPDLWNDHVTSTDFLLPYRNLLLLTTGAAFAQTIGLEAVYAAFIDANFSFESDASLEFLNRMAGMLCDYGCSRIEFPFREKTKSEVAILGYELGAPIASTYSCLASPNVPCGACANCVDREEALDAVRIAMHRD